MMIPPTCVTTSGDAIEIRGCTPRVAPARRRLGPSDRRQRDRRRQRLGVRLRRIERPREPPAGHSVGCRARRDRRLGARRRGQRRRATTSARSGSPARRARGSSSNRVRTRWWGSTSADCTGCESRGNEVERTMRAQCVEGGRRTPWPGNRRAPLRLVGAGRAGRARHVVLRQRSRRLPRRHADLGEHVRICSYRRDDGAVRAGVSTAATCATPVRTPWDPTPGAVVGPLDAVTLVAPVPAPGKVVCVGRNYAEHAAETGSAVTDRAPAVREVGERGGRPGRGRRPARDHARARLRGGARRGRSGGPLGT